MALRIGQVLRGVDGKYEILEALKGSTVFKVRVLSSPSTKSNYAVIKSAVTDNDKYFLDREFLNYKVPEIASCPQIRTLHDTVQPPIGDKDETPFLVFDWMDNELRTISDARFRGDARLPRIVSKAVLMALDVFKKLDAVHTDVNINNVYLSDIDGPSPIAKLGDLGNLVPVDAFKQRVQSLPCRAPEIWQGYGYQPACDVWSLGVTLVHRLSPLTIFGPRDKIIEGLEEAWCIAKIIRLVGPVGPCVDDDEVYKDALEIAPQLEVMDNPLTGTKLITRGTLREELRCVPEPPVPEQLLDFIDYLLVVDPAKRPTAAEALQHPYLQSAE